MYSFKSYILIFSLILCVMSSGCIHEYPDGNSNDPSGVEVGIELTLDLKWGEDEMQPNFSTRARGDSQLRVVTEVSRNGDIVGHDETFVNDEEIKLGKMRRRLPFQLHAVNYDIAVWCDYYDPTAREGYFDASDLKAIEHTNPGIEWSEDRKCGYSKDNLDLRQYKGQWDVRIIKEMALSHAGARFRLITTDMRRFVEEEIDAIEDGETYTITVNYGIGTSNFFNAFTGRALSSYSASSSTKPFKPSYTIYGDMTISEGFILCDEEETVTMSVTVHNSARMIVVKSPEFSFKVKRGMISIVTGEFLSEKFNNNISVNNIWEGEIIIDI